MSLKITEPGALSTIQDRGRIGYMKDGFPQSGVMDDYSFAMANRLLGNDPNAAAIEMTLTGIRGIFTAPCRFIAAGADFGGTLNDAPITPNTVCCAQAGDSIAFGRAKNGCRCYFVPEGGVDVPPVMQSRSTNLKCCIGGLAGRKLQKNDVLHFIAVKTNPACDGLHFENPMPGDMLTVRALPGPQDDYFTKEELALFFSQDYTVTIESDRMGMKLDGQPLQGKKGMDIVSDGIAKGAVQIPSSGKPIILLADRQTTGGYAKIATVLTCDLHLLAQARPSARIRFVRVNQKEAEKAALAYYKKIAEPFGNF